MMRQIHAMSLIWILSVNSIACAEVHLPTEAKSLSQNQQVLHVLNRLGYGPTPESVTHVKKIGVAAYIDEQLSPKKIPESPVLLSYLRTLPTLSMTPEQLVERQESFAAASMADTNMSDVQQQSSAQLGRKLFAAQVMSEARSDRLSHAVLSDRQLEAALTEFWFNHFNVYSRAGINKIMTGVYDREVIRANALGHFDQLLLATARSVAMSNYLNNRVSTRAFVSKRGKQFGLNENYAREVMELHTLGVNGGYTQKDVTELARILTGWGYDVSGKHTGNETDLFLFRDGHHDKGDKIFLGQEFHNDGVKEGERALKMLAEHPATARFISAKLAEYFVSDQPSAELVNQMAKTYSSSHGDIRKVLETMFSSADFWQAKNQLAKFKTPYQYVVSSIRVSGVKPTEYWYLADKLEAMNMPLYGYLTPDGYKQVKSAWLSPTAISARVDYATAFGRGVFPLQTAKRTKPSQQQRLASMPKTEQLHQLLGPILSDRTQQAVQNAPSSLKAALLLSSPEFMAR